MWCVAAAVCLAAGQPGANGGATYQDVSVGLAGTARQRQQQQWMEVIIDLHIQLNQGIQLEDKLSMSLCIDGVCS